MKIVGIFSVTPAIHSIFSPTCVLIEMNSEEFHHAHADCQMSTLAHGDHTPFYNEYLNDEFALPLSDSTNLSEGSVDNVCFDDSISYSTDTVMQSEDVISALPWPRSDFEDGLMPSGFDSLGIPSSPCTSPTLCELAVVPDVSFSGDLPSLLELPIDCPTENSECLQSPVCSQSSLPANGAFMDSNDLNSSNAEVISQPSDSDGDASDGSPCISVFCKKRTRKAKHEWTHEEDCQLIAIVDSVFKKYPNRKKGCWPEIAKCFNSNAPERHMTAKQCREHYSRITSHYTKNAWRVDENDVIDRYLRQELSIDEVFMRLNRTNKQIKERIRTMQKANGPWSEKEEMKLFELYRKYGPRYVRISDEMWNCGFLRDYQQVKNKVTALLK